MSATPASGALTRSQIENWDTTHLESMATRWVESADQSETLFEQQNQPADGWAGAGSDAAADRTAADLAVVRQHGDVARRAAAIATDGAGDLRAALRAALEAIAEAEAAGFRVGEDLSVRDTRRIDVSTMADRYRMAKEHAENIQWHADQLLQTDKLIGSRLEASATELDSIRFAGEGEYFPADGIVHAVDFKQWPILDHDKPWEYNLDLTTRVWLDAPGKPSAGTIMSVDDVWKELNRCFNCNFPMGGAPAKMPKVGDHLPLEIERFGIHAADFPVEVTQIDKTANEINIEFATLPGHVDGEGSTIHFRFYESGGEVHLGIRGYIAHGPGTDEGWVGAPIRAGYGQVAALTWQPYIDRLAANIAAAEGAVPVLTKGP